MRSFSTRGVLVHTDDAALRELFPQKFLGFLNARSLEFDLLSAAFWARLRRRLGKSALVAF